MNWVHTLASIITIGTAIINVLIAVFNNEINIFFVDIEKIHPVIRFTLFVYLELIISLFFGYIKVKVLPIYLDSTWFWVIFFLPAIICVFWLSAWTSVFNIDLLIVDLDSIGSYISGEELMIMLFMASLSVIIMAVIGGYIKGIIKNKSVSFSFEIARGFAIIHAFSMLVVLGYRL
ncbi:MAG: hypothetical protein LGR52_03140 [Candidatus Thiosymbion ectosymbiont of Robbea hypermnestra]|nr:hypothetical protein [Candidatus Thiosymbion ectosymbiont of Robbea hypermnestra]